MYVCIIDSLCYIPETNNTVNQPDSNKKKFLRKNKLEIFSWIFFFLIYNKDLQKRKLKKPSEFNVKSNFQLPRIQPFLPNVCVWPLLKNSQADGRRAGQENMEAGPTGLDSKVQNKR